MSAVTVIRWAVLDPDAPSQSRRDVPAGMVEEIRRAHRLGNDLVEVHQAREARVDEIWAAHPDVAALSTTVEAARVVVDELAGRASEARRQARSTQVPAGLRKELAAARRILREQRAALRAAKSVALDEAGPAFRAAADDERAAVKALYRSSVDGGLYWASYNEVVDRWRTACKRVAAERSAGRPAQLRFRRWDGSGTIAVQLQRGAHQPVRTPELLASDGSPWRNVLAVSPPDTGRVGTVRVRIGSGDHAAHVGLRVLMHRPLPTDADVTLARVTRERVAGRYQAWVSVVCLVPEAVPEVDGVAAVHLGWRSLGDDGVRVAAVECPTPPPDALADVVRWHDTWAEIVAPRAWLREDRALHDLDSVRGEALRDALDVLASWLAEHGPVEWGDRPLSAGDVRRWRSAGRLAALTLAWRDGARPDGSDDLVAALEEWRRVDRRRWERLTHQRRKLAGRRRDRWRCVAGWLTSSSTTLVVDEWRVSDLARPGPVEVEDTEQARAARRARVVVAPGELRAEITRAAKSRGVEVVPGAVRSRVHAGCGGELPATLAESAVVECPACRRMVDQDRSAVAQLVAAARGPAAA